jgi:soluble lytic murein transglycosylase
MPNCLAKITLVLCCSIAGPAADGPTAATGRPKAAGGARTTLTKLVHAYRAGPTPARRAAVEQWAKLHQQDAPLVELALGVAAYEQKDYSAAVIRLRKARPKLARIADYVGYYLGAARVEAGDFEGVAGDLDPAHGQPPSLEAGRAWLVEARARQASDAPGAVKLLRDHYAELPQPEGGLALADCYVAAGDPSSAADFVERANAQFVTGDGAARAAEALRTLQERMGAAFPQPLPQQVLRRADRLLETRQYEEARAEYQSAAERLTGTEHDQALVRANAVAFLAGHAGTACDALSGMQLNAGEADAERLYYAAECAHHAGDEAQVNAALERLAAQYPKSRWRLKALVAAAGRRWAENKPESYLALYRAAYQDFAGDSLAAQWHWRVAFRACFERRGDAEDLLREQLRNYPGSPSAAAALYFLGRLAEERKDFGAARLYYERVMTGMEGYYYAARARERLRVAEVRNATGAAQAAEFLAGVILPTAEPVPTQATAATELRIARSRVLRSAGLADLADEELRFGARTDGQPALLAMEGAAAAEAPYQGMRMMKALAPDYLNLRLTEAPRRFWELLFPLPYRAELTADARRRSLDPFLVAGLVRQESEFNPEAVSRSHAYGLTQVQPGTGRQFARTAGVGRVTPRVLVQPAANLRIGTTILRAMLDQNAGDIEQTLAAYNAGPNRVAEWLSWYTYREPAEFVESIPYGETREYVQAVLRNAEMYRRLYR